MISMLFSDGGGANARVRRASGVMFVIAGLSVLRVFMNLSNGGGGVAVTSLGLTNWLSSMGPAMAPVAIGTTVVAAGLYIFLGIMARKAVKWAFITAMAVYGLDAVLIYFVSGSYGILGVGFHAIILYRLFLGYQACDLPGVVPGAGGYAQPGAWTPPPTAYGQPGQYPQQPGAHGQPGQYPQQPGAYGQPGQYPQQPGAYGQPGQYPQQPGAYGQPGQYPQQPGAYGQPGQYPRQPGAYGQPGQYPQQPGAYGQPGQPPQTPPPVAPGRFLNDPIDE
ncbi:MAG: hypothetical protein ACLQVD_00250 [Capsulimonadaceae bacterium]